MCERILAQNCQKFDNFNFEFSMSHHNAHYQSYKNAPVSCYMDLSKLGLCISRSMLNKPKLTKISKFVEPSAFKAQVVE